MTTPAKIDAKVLASLPPETQDEIREALDTINHVPLLPAGEQDYQQAWKTLLEKLPRQVGRPLAARIHSQMKEKDPYRAILSPLLQGAGVCYSSQNQAIPHQAKPAYDNPEISQTGWDHEPKIEESLKQGLCFPEEVMAILKDDLPYIMGPRCKEILKEIAVYYWQESEDFARAFLKLANRTSYRDKFWPEHPDYLAKAILQLIPADGKPQPGDEKLIDGALHKVMQEQPKKKSDAFFNSLVRARPVYEAKLREMARLLLKLP